MGLGFKYRFAASKTPPADTFSAVVNSRNSSPVAFLPRMKNGIEIRTIPVAAFRRRQWTETFDRNLLFNL